MEDPGEAQLVIPTASEDSTNATLAKAIDVLSTSEIFPVSEYELAEYLAENCSDARGDIAEEFLTVRVPKLLDRMRRTGMVEVKVNGFRLTANGRWSLLRKAEEIAGGR
jgi:hypothetical protein